MVFSALILCTIAFAETKTLAVQIALDRHGFSCNTIDGSWGRKSESALRAYCAANKRSVPASAEEAYDELFAGEQNLFKSVTVTEADLHALVNIPKDSAARAELPRMGYESLAEMFAERGHVSVRALERLNPGLDFSALKIGTSVKLPDFPTIDEELSVWPKDSRTPKRPEASLVKISLSRCEISVYDAEGSLIALFPCSIAKDKAKRPSAGELKITTPLARPNYTYTPDRPTRGKLSRHVWPEGPNSPIGVAWLGLNLPGYGIHGTPRPETIGSAESHGCFRLANWNAARLYALCPRGTRVIIEQ